MTGAKKLLFFSFFFLASWCVLFFNFRKTSVNRFVPSFVLSSYLNVKFLCKEGKKTPNNKKKKSFLFTCLLRSPNTLLLEVNETENYESIPIQTSESTIFETINDMETQAIPSVSPTNLENSGKFLFYTNVSCPSRNQSNREDIIQL